ncbi:RNA helicase [Skunkpox virus]|uniref:RNA helicase NPH-II n=1 Tax=Skunkpox virus TaxID=160796 RepID=A0A1C9KBM9_9POXV|nr:RNA helicase [Skunkpox virus]AOP31555.1 RNA helicase [Skunkpox virus]
MEKNLPDIFFFPNCVNIFSYKYTQDEFSNMTKKERERFLLAVFPIIKHRWNNAHVIKHRGVYKVSTEARGEKIDPPLIGKPEHVNLISKRYLSNGVTLSFECYSFIKCTMNIDINSFDDYILRGLLEAGNSLNIFVNAVGKRVDTVGVLGNKYPFSKIPLASLTPKAQREIFSAWISHRPVVLTGGTGVGKTSQVPKLLLWFNYLFGGFPTLDKITDFHERPVILSLPRIALVRLHSNTILKSLGFKTLDGSPVSLRYGSIPDEFINKNPKKYGIIFSTHKLSLTKLFSYGTLIIDEVHEHDQIGDIIIAVARKHISKIDSMFLMTATLEDDRERLKVFLPNPVFIHIPGETLFKITEVFIHNKISPSYRMAYIEEEKRNLVTAIQMYTPPNGSSGIIFVATVSQCHEYKEYLEKRIPYDIYIIHGKILDIDDILEKVYSSPDVSIIISTPYLESSVTIRNVTHIYDTGRVFVPAPFGGSQKFISRSMREQRKGRVGRVNPGTYIYFYDLSYMQSIQRIDSEFLHNYILYANKFNLKLPEDLFIVPTNLDILWLTKEYIESFDISPETWNKLLSNYYMKMIEYAKLYVLSPILAKELDNFERTGELTNAVKDAILSLNLRVKILNSKHKDENTCIHFCKILFGVYSGTNAIIYYHRCLNGYMNMISDSMFVPVDDN